MKYLFDSSAIFRAIKENRIDLLIGNYTLEMARFELGVFEYLDQKFSNHEWYSVSSIM